MKVDHFKHLGIVASAMLSFAINTFCSNDYRRVIIGYEQSPLASAFQSTRAMSLKDFFSGNLLNATFFYPNPTALNQSQNYSQIGQNYNDTTVVQVNSTGVRVGNYSVNESALFIVDYHFIPNVTFQSQGSNNSSMNTSSILLTNLKNNSIVQLPYNASQVMIVNQNQNSSYILHGMDGNYGGGVIFNNSSSKVFTRNQGGSSLIFYETEQILLPPLNITSTFELLKQSNNNRSSLNEQGGVVTQPQVNLTTFWNALQQNSTLLQKVQDSKGITIFAVNNANQQSLNQTSIADYIAFNVTAYSPLLNQNSTMNYSNSTWPFNQTLSNMKSFSGKRYNFTASNDAASLNGTQIIRKDILLSNGVMHVVNQTFPMQ